MKVASDRVTATLGPDCRATMDDLMKCYKAKSSCRHCHGRGYEGRNDQGEIVPCRCLRPIK